MMTSGKGLLLGALGGLLFREARVRAVRDASACLRETTLPLTGRAQGIQAVREAFRALSLAPPRVARASSTEGKVGLD